jgi:hypothetical protein
MVKALGRTLTKEKSEGRIEGIKLTQNGVDLSLISNSWNTTVNRRNQCKEG